MKTLRVVAAGAPPRAVAGPATPPKGARPASRPAPPGLGGAEAGTLLLPGLHFGAAMVFLLAGSAGLIAVSHDLAAGNFLSQRVAGVTHLFTLGWLTTTIYGALYQLLPVALGAPVRSRAAGCVSFAAHAPGAAIFACGVALGNVMLHHAGIALVATGVLLLVANLGLSLPAARERDVTWAAVALALTALVSTLLLGVVLLHNLHTGFLLEARVRVLSIHLHVAIVGWALVMMVGMSHRLLPMFLLAHGANAGWTRRALLLIPTGLTILVAALALRVRWMEWMGLVVLEAGVVCYLVQCRVFFAARIRPALDVGLRFSAIALCMVAASAAMGPILMALGGVRQPRLAVAYVTTGLLGGVVLFTVGQFYKIVPFLAWISRFRSRVGKGAVPTVADLYSAKVARVQLVIMAAAVLSISAGVLAGAGVLVRLGAVGFAAGVVIFAAQVMRVAGWTRAAGG